METWDCSINTGTLAQGIKCPGCILFTCQYFRIQIVYFIAEYSYCLQLNKTDLDKVARNLVRVFCASVPGVKHHSIGFFYFENGLADPLGIVQAIFKYANNQLDFLSVHTGI